MDDQMDDMEISLEDWEGDRKIIFSSKTQELYLSKEELSKEGRGGGGRLMKYYYF